MLTPTQQSVLIRKSWDHNSDFDIRFFDFFLQNETYRHVGGFIDLISTAETLRSHSTANDVENRDKIVA